MINENFPDKATLTEVGPRDGFQFEAKVVPTEIKVEIISRLIEAGLKRIQATSFVHPKLVPQMADAEELLSRLPKREDVLYSGLALNIKGVERAHTAGLRHIEVSVSASDTHSRKNAGISSARAVEQGKEMIRLAQKYNMHITASIQCAFGCVYEGSVPEDRVLKIAQDFIGLGIDKLSLADTTGMANPLSIKTLLELKTETDGSLLNSSVPIGIHLHDTRGLGLANVMAAMACGIAHFDTAMGGMGGCPFVTAAAGNIATEDTAYLMKSMNIETGIDIPAVAECSKRLEKFFGKSFSGKIYRLSDIHCE
ncbi:hydroxymethylglutaryl-CoA lyase [Desulfobacterales bacterium HSG2]|nr:hydroxymethylglutaryl-CoA lyase [Desulfobacterales bacterium HSG2]